MFYQEMTQCLFLAFMEVLTYELLTVEHNLMTTGVFKSILMAHGKIKVSFFFIWLIVNRVR